MRFRYTEIHNHQNPAAPFQRPYVVVRLAHGERHKDVISLVDSGADLCLFHADIGRLLGLQVEAGIELNFPGVSGAAARAHVHRVVMTVRGLNSMNVDVGFTESMTVGTGLLGQQGFFQQLRVAFNLKNNFFEIEMN